MRISKTEKNHPSGQDDSSQRVNLKAFYQEFKKREQLKQRIMKIQRETGIYTLDMESLFSNLIKKDLISVYAFLDQRESDLLG